MALARSTLVCLIVTIAAGCASINSSQRAQVEQITAPESWRVSGKASVSSQETAQLFNYFWQYQSDYERLELNANNAGRIFSYERKQQRSQLNVAGREPIFDIEPDAALKELLGWELPIAQLRYWLVGKAYPETRIAAVEFDDAGRLLKLSQHGWDLSYRGYHSAQSYQLPRLIVLNKGRFKVRIFVNNWQLPAEWVALRATFTVEESET